ncbi:MAG: hypothetical protein JXR96_20590 [Deltaproteobacteria bacterium]|nr:hypothetical protein [Deltaproteobacteria bacterium]
MARCAWLCSLLLALLAARAEARQAAEAAVAKPRFKTTRAQQSRPRVRGARERRLADIRALFARAGLDYPPAQVLMRIFKSEDKLELWVRKARSRDFVHLKDYAICARSGELGPKRKRHDGQVPEGFYTITAYNSASSFLLAMLVSYPNRSDLVRKHGRDPGGAICIHGDCVTIGCVPLTDRWIEELYVICLDSKTWSGQPNLVHIFPARLHGESWDKLVNEHAAEPALLDFWKELKAGYDLFEQTRRQPRIWFTGRGAYRFRAR